MATQVFDTFRKGAQVYLIEYLTNLRAGMLLVFAVKDDASFQLKDTGRKVLRSLGSRHINKIAFRDTWVLGLLMKDWKHIDFQGASSRSNQ